TIFRSKFIPTKSEVGICAVFIAVLFRKQTHRPFFFSIYPAMSPPLGVRREPDATLRFAPLTQHVLPQTQVHHKKNNGFLYHR
ncbi:MAG: hypothetical protein RSB88_06290, partial [Akkermansia sp.]